jgi:GT2 family glycosyltransferase
MSQPRVRVVVLNYNGGRLLERTFAALEATVWPRDRLDLVMIDNASTDASRQLVADSFPKVTIIDSPVNSGFPANNLALRSLTEVDFVALVNSDAFVEPDWLAPLVAGFDGDLRVGATCPKILLASRFVDISIETPSMSPARGDPRSLGVRLHAVRVDGTDVLGAMSGDGVHGLEHDAGRHRFRWTSSGGTLSIPVSDHASDGPWHIEIEASRVDHQESVVITVGTERVVTDVGPASTTISFSVGGPAYSLVNNAGSVVLNDGYGADRGYLQPDGPAFDQPGDVFAWCGAAVLFRPDYLRDVGLFDERFFLYYEDIDLSWRGQHRGWRYRYVPESQVRHMHAATSVEGSNTFRHYTERNRLAMLTKNAPRPLAWRSPLRFLWSTGSYARRDIAGPLRRGRRPQLTLVGSRLRSFGGWLLMLPYLLGERRGIRRSSVRTDAEIEAKLSSSARVETT